MNPPNNGRTAIPVFDGHNDVLLRLHAAGRESEKSFFEQGDPVTGNDIDLPRMIKGGMLGGFFAVWVPADPDETVEEGTPVPPVGIAYAQRTALSLASILFRLEERSGGRLQVVKNAAEIENCLAAGVVAAVLHFEGAEAIDPALDALEVLYRAGMRSLGPVWSRPNAFGHGVPFEHNRTPDTGPGLTDAGRELVRACNHRRIMLDLSHLNEQGFWEVAALTDSPLVATHSNAHAICPSTRNLTDRQLDAIRESDGMVGVNFGVRFLRPDGMSDTSTPLDMVADHVDYLATRLGIDRVGFGSDFDGTTVPDAIGDVTGYPALLDTLRRRGYDDESLHKVAYRNWVRVLRKTWGA